MTASGRKLVVDTFFHRPSLFGIIFLAESERIRALSNFLNSLPRHKPQLWRRLSQRRVAVVSLD